MDGFRDYYDNQELISLYLNSKNKKLKEIAQLTGKSIGEIYRTLHNYNVTPDRLKVNHRNVLEFANFGFSISQIAELTGYTPRNVRYILAKNR